MSIVDKIKDKINSFHCQACGKKCDNREEPKYQIYLEKWYEREAKSAVDVKLCPDCAAPVIDVLRKAKALAAMRRDDVDVDPTQDKKPYHFAD